MNKLSLSSRSQVVAALVEGNSIRATCRMTGVDKGAVLKLLVDLGAACESYQDVTLRNLKLTFALPIFPPPGILSGLPPATTWQPRAWYCINHEEVRKTVQKHSGTGLAIGPIKTLAFAQMLAKIAHSYAVAQMGLDTFNPLLLDLIFGRTTVVTHLVGGDLKVPPPASWLHHLDLHREHLAEGRKFVVADIRLIGYIG